MMNTKQIGLRIKQCRRDQKLTQEKFAELIGVSPHYVYEIERGMKTMSIYTLMNIITNLNVSADYILFGDDAPCTIFTRKNTPDSLDILTNSLPITQRENVAEIISFLLPYIK